MALYQHIFSLFCFGTTTMPAHHGVGVSTFEITLSDSMRDNLSLTFWQRGMGTCKLEKVLPWVVWLFQNLP